MRKNNTLYFEVYSIMIFLYVFVVIIINGDNTLHPQLLKELSKRFKKGKLNYRKALESEDLN